MSGKLFHFSAHEANLAEQSLDIVFVARVFVFVVVFFLLVRSS